jgi:putative addiction module component (TIGR02574 family)
MSTAAADAFSAVAQQASQLGHFEQLELACSVWDNWAAAAVHSTASTQVLDLLSQRAAQRDAGQSPAISFDEMVTKLGIRL